VAPISKQLSRRLPFSLKFRGYCSTCWVAMRRSAVSSFERVMRQHSARVLFIYAGQASKDNLVQNVVKSRTSMHRNFIRCSKKCCAYIARLTRRLSKGPIKFLLLFQNIIFGAMHARNFFVWNDPQGRPGALSRQAVRRKT
jgi:hypothetical protein